MTKPDFFIVGAPKSGTTAITEYLREHPQIFIPEGKEFHYFGKDLQFADALPVVDDKQEYLNLFESAGSTQVVGESSVLYLYSRSAPKEIKSFQPESRIIILLRNPVDMVHSEHQQLVYSGAEPENDFQEALKKRKRQSEGKSFPEDYSFPHEISYRALAKRADHVARYFDVFGRENVQVIIFEEFFDNPTKGYKKILKFLGVEQNYQPEFERVNVRSAERFPGLNRWLRDPDGWPGSLIRTILELIGPKIRQRLLSIYKWINTRQRESQEISKTLRKKLLEEFREDIEELEEVLGRRLSLWYEYD